MFIKISIQNGYIKLSLNKILILYYYNMSARKVPEKLENPIDNYFIDIATILNPVFYKIGFNANGITTLSLIFGLLSCYLYYNKIYGISGIIMIISYYFDVMDGNFARKYNMQSKFGDYYDHIKDFTVLFIIVCLILLNKDLPLYLKISGGIIGLLLLFGTITHLGCIEKYVIHYNNNNKIKESEILSIFKYCCNSMEKIKNVRYFGSGTANVYLSIFILLHIFL